MAPARREVRGTSTARGEARGYQSALRVRVGVGRTDVIIHATLWTIFVSPQATGVYKILFLIFGQKARNFGLLQGDICTLLACL